MKYAPLLLLALAACPGDDDANPDTLWLAPDKSETQVKLVDAEPNPY
jgi:hypothetical protein